MEEGACSVMVPRREWVYNFISICCDPALTVACQYFPGRKTRTGMVEYRFFACRARLRTQKRRRDAYGKSGAVVETLPVGRRGRGCS